MLNDKLYLEYGIERAPRGGAEVYVHNYTGGGTAVERVLSAEDVNTSRGATVRDYLALLAELGLDEPVGDVAERYQECLALIKQARHPDFNDDPTVSVTERSARRDEASARIRSEAKAKYNAILRDLSNVGESGFLELLRPVVDDCIAKVRSDRATGIRQAERSWTLIQKLCGALRVAGILPSVKGASPNAFHYAEPERVFFYRCMTSKSLKTQADAHDGMMFYSTVRPDSPQMTLAKALEIDAGPGLYTAQDVVAHTITWRAGFDAALYGDEPATSGTKKLRMVGF